MNFNNFLDGTKRMIALLLAVVFCAISVYTVITEKKIPEPLVQMFAIVVGFYFGRATAEKTGSDE